MKPPASTNRSSGKTSEQWRDLILVHYGEKDLMNSRPPDPPGTSRPCGRPPVENLGEILAGDLIENSPYEVKMLENIDCKVLSKHQLDQEMEDKFRSRGTFSGGAHIPPRAPGTSTGPRGLPLWGPLLGSTQPVPASRYDCFSHSNTGPNHRGTTPREHTASAGQLVQSFLSYEYGDPGRRQHYFIALVRKLCDMSYRPSSFGFHKTLPPPPTALLSLFICQRTTSSV